KDAAQERNRKAPRAQSAAAVAGCRAPASPARRIAARIAVTNFPARPAPGRPYQARKRTTRSMRDLTKIHSNDRGTVTTFEEGQRWIADRGIEEIECIVPDQAGVARGKIVPAAKFFE